MRVVISAGGIFHVRHAAKATWQAGCLARLITTVRPDGDDGLDPRLITWLPLPEYLGQAIRRVPLLRNAITWNWVKDNLFDRMAARHVPPCDVFHVWNNYGLYSMPRARRTGAKVLVDRASVHPQIERGWLAGEYEKRGLRYPARHQALATKQGREFESADAILVPSSLVYDSMVAAGVPRAKLIKLLLGTAPVQEPQPVRDGSITRVLFVGTVSFRKGVPYLLDAVHPWHGSSLELIFVGPIDEDVRRLLAAQRGLLRLIPATSQTALASYYASASMLVLPSVADGFGMVVTEAMARGLPVIVSDHVGAAELVHDGVDGFVVPYANAAALRERISFLHEHPAEREAMGRAARAHVSAFTWRHYGDGLLAAYRQLMTPETPA